MHVVLRDIQSILPYARNPRNNQAAVAKVAASIQEFGFKQPIVVDADNTIVVGHTRWLAAQKLGMAQVPVLVADDLTAPQIKAYRLADNRTHEEATWDNDLLALELGELRASDFDLTTTGFNAEEMAMLTALTEAVETGLTDEEDCPETVDQPTGRLGDVWVLGRHRLMCGDATSFEAVSQLMKSEQGDMGFTDPPYNVAYEGYTADKLTLLSDAQSPEQFQTFLEKIFKAYHQALKQTASFYVCHASLHQHSFHNALEESGFTVRMPLVWAKHHFAWGMGRYKFQHEPIFYCHKHRAVDLWYGDKTQSSLWQFDKPSANRLHPTMKPVALIEKAIVNSSQPGMLVVDLLGGSGSTLIACEKTGRRAYMMELDPQYCDVIIKRWEAFTGSTAVLEKVNHSSLCVL
jgi:DNA modification methylase